MNKISVSNKIMQIKVLGACCAACNATFENIKKAANEIDAKIEVSQIDNVLEILKYRVMQTPAVVIDDVVVCAGKDLNFDEAKKIILTGKLSETRFIRLKD